jgi:hypothetical protein
MKTQGIRVWLDDCRPMPADFNVWARTAAEAIALIETDTVIFISLDHDLGDEAICGTGYQVAKRIEELAHDGAIPPIDWAVHSANPVGRANMEAAMRGARRWWSERIQST